MSHSKCLCFLCVQPLEDEEDEKNVPIECDECGNYFHSKCIRVGAKDIRARKDSNCLRLYCTICIDSKKNSVEERLKQLFQWVQKMDLSIQGQNPQISVNSQLVKAMSSKIDNLETVIGSFGKRGSSANNNDTIGEKNSQPSYASMAKKPSVKPAVVIKPKKKQDSKSTLDAVTTSVDKGVVKVCGTRNVRDGGVVLRCSDTAETMKVKQLICEKMGDAYEVILPKIKKPRLRVTNIATDIPKESIIDELKKHNDEIKDIEMKLVTVINHKSKGRKPESNELVVEVDGAAHQKLLNIQILNLPWRECRVLEHVYIKRCYKCLGFNHIAQSCTGDQKCSKCGGNHKYSDCKSKSLCCANCRSQNGKNKTNLDTKHHAWSRECPVYKRRVTSIVNNIEYNASE